MPPEVTTANACRSQCFRLPIAVLLHQRREQLVPQLHRVRSTELDRGETLRVGGRGVVRRAVDGFGGRDAGQPAAAAAGCPGTQVAWWNGTFPSPVPEDLDLRRGKELIRT